MIWKGSPLGFERDLPLAHAGNEPTLILGPPPGSFKTVGPIMGELLDEPGQRSYIVHDPKLEIAAVTANYRRRVCGAENVKIINPYGLLVDHRPDLKSDGWNPYGDLDPDAFTFGDDCAAKGDALVKTSSNEHQKHFPDTAREAITGRTMQEVREARAQNFPPSLANVRHFFTQEPAVLKDAVKKLLEKGDFDVTSRLARFLADNQEIEGVKSTIATNLAFLTRPMRDDMVTADGVDLRACKQRPTTIYLGLPTQEQSAKSVYLRLFLSSALRALYREDGVPVTLLVEEAFVLGRHEELLQALSILRGFNSRVTVVAQSLQQIKSLYPDTWGLFMSGAVLGFRPGDFETAEWMTKRAGEVVMPVPSVADPSSPSEFRTRPSWSPQKRERVPVGKMFAMPRQRALVWLPGDEAPHKVRVKGYFEIPELNAHADPNPYYRGQPNPSGKARRQWPALWWKSAAAVLMAGVIIGGAGWWWAGATSSAAADDGQSMTRAHADHAPHRPARRHTP